jgi:hypothetical protein
MHLLDRFEPSTFFDEDAEAVRLKLLEEQREEAEVKKWLYMTGLHRVKGRRRRRSHRKGLRLLRLKKGFSMMMMMRQEIPERICLQTWFSQNPHQLHTDS